MSHFIQLGARTRRLPDGVSEDMNVIERIIRGKNLFRIFSAKVRGLCKKKKKSSLFTGLAKDKTAEKLVHIIGKTRKDLDALGLPTDQEFRTHDQYDQAAVFLKDAIKMLNDLETTPQPMARLEEELDEEIKKDKAIIDKNLKPLANKVSMALKQIDLYWLKRPHQILKTIVAPPDKTIRDDFLVYRQLRGRLRAEGLVQRPDLWVRQEDKDRRMLTKNGRHWVYAKPTEEIDMAKERLDIDVVDVSDKGAYIVAVLNEEDGQEIPVVLDLFKGDEDCCQSKCGTLKRHLETLWGDRIIKQARRLTSKEKPDPSNPPDIAMHDDLSTHPLDDDWFDRERTELYISTKMRPQARPTMTPVATVAVIPITTMPATPVTTAVTP